MRTSAYGNISIYWYYIFGTWQQTTDEHIYTHKQKHALFFYLQDVDDREKRYPPITRIMIRNRWIFVIITVYTILRLSPLWEGKGQNDGTKHYVVSSITRKTVCVSVCVCKCVCLWFAVMFRKCGNSKSKNYRRLLFAFIKSFIF